MFVDIMVIMAEIWCGGGGDCEVDACNNFEADGVDANSNASGDGGVLVALTW